MTSLDDLKDSATFGAWVSRIEERLKPSIDEYAKRVLSAREPGFRSDPGAPAKTAKAVKDALWGMVDVDRRELVVLDSPPMQRLRRIRQLGVSYLTYPSASYSRFEHVVGAMHQAERMARAIAKRSRPSESQIVEDSIPVARLAALLHDVGHLPLSHISERYYSEQECVDAEIIDEVQQALGDVVEILGGESVHLGEVLSLALMLTPCYWNLLHDVAGYTQEELSAASLAIVATPTTAQTAFLPNLISNVIDADKLDYLFRDAFVTRIPLAVDLERLLYKLKVVAVTGEGLPDKLQAITPSGQAALLVATDSAGNELIGDLLRARAMLFQRVYLHHKTRAAERVALDILRDLERHPTDLLAEDDSICDGSGAHFETGGTISSSVRRLVERDLPRRAYAMAYRFLLDKAEIGDGGRPELAADVVDGVDGLRDLLQLASEREALRSAIAARRDSLAELVGHTSAAELWLEPEPTPYDIDDPDIQLELPDGTIKRAGGFGAKGAAFTQERLATTYVFCAGTDKDVQLAAVASELEIVSRFNTVFGRAALDNAKVDLMAVDQLKRDLERASPAVFAEFGSLRPPSAYLRTEQGQARLRGLATRWSTYNVGDAPAKPAMSVQHVQDFLDQFPESLVKPMLVLLEGLVFLTRDDLGRRFVENMSPVADDFGTLVAVPLTMKLTKSAMALMHLFEDAQHAPQLVANLPEALEKINDGSASRIVLFDDYTLSGRQARTVVQRWLGLEPDLPEEFEAVAKQLTNEEVQVLRSSNVSFRFVYAEEGGIAAISELLDACSIPNDVKSLVPGIGTDEGVGASSETLRTFLREVGTELLSSTKGIENPMKWNGDLIADRALGYGNGALLVASYFNVPTGTITALWKCGTFRGIDWIPLFPRRETS